jgi:hypothetical protein
MNFLILQKVRDFLLYEQLLTSKEELQSFEVPYRPMSMLNSFHKWAETLFKGILYCNFISGCKLLFEDTSWMRWRYSSVYWTLPSTSVFQKNLMKCEAPSVTLFQILNSQSTHILKCCHLNTSYGDPFLQTLLYWPDQCYYALVLVLETWQYLSHPSIWSFKKA